MVSFKHIVPLVLAVLLGPAASLTLQPTAAAWAGTGGARATKASTNAPAETGTTAAGTETTTTGGASTGGSEPESVGTSRKALATWYGPGFYGHMTACGQKMSPTLVGVASRTLACGTLVRFAFGGHELTVPVLDRGPYGGVGAKWDLTAGAARTLGIRETVRVTTKVVGSLPNGATLGQAPEAAPLSEPAASGAPAVEASATGGSGASTAAAG
jgi:rare lipoprotein A (peptidoglycan hydrolase)